MIRARAGLVRARTSLVTTARSLAKSYGERLDGCNVRNMNPEKAESLSPELQVALKPLLHTIESLSERIVEYNEQRSDRRPGGATVSAGRVAEADHEPFMGQRRSIPYYLAGVRLFRAAYEFSTD